MSVVTRRKVTGLGALAATAAMLLSHAGTAWADPELEIGGFLGAHVFSGENELGVDDVSNPDTPGSAFAPGLRAAFSPFSLLAIEGEVTLMPSTTRMSKSAVQVLGYRVQGLLQLMGSKRRFRPFALFGVGGMAVDPSTDMRRSSQDIIQSDNDTMLHVGTGMKYRMWENWGARADVRLLFPPSTSGDDLTTDWEFFVGIYRSFGGGSTSAPSRSELPSYDSDGDGDTDIGWLESDVEPNARPKHMPKADKKVAMRAGDKPPKRTSAQASKPDGDNDGVADDSDYCPDVPEDHDNFLDRDGCPEPDNDGDLIADIDDRCPLAAETENGFNDEDGCPDKLPPAISQVTGTVTGIAFKNKSSKLTQKAAPVLDRIAEMMLKHKSVRFEIQAHTAITGRKGRRLSNRRAAAAKEYLVGHGIDAERLEAKGYGAAFPVASNATAAGRKRNERIGFKLLVEGIAPAKVCTKKSKDPECKRDDDGDNIANAIDMCPDNAEDMDHFIDDDGCPEPDNDADLIADDEDRCPLKSENPNGYKDNDGCPDTMPAAVASLIGTVPGLSFKGRAPTLAPGSAVRVKKLAAVLKKHKGFSLEIQVHTFPQRSEKTALAMTQRQADALKHALVKAGVEELRLEAVGYGSAHPITSNRGNARFKNQRVTLRLIVEDPDETEDE